MRKAAQETANGMPERAETKCKRAEAPVLYFRL